MIYYVKTLFDQITPIGIYTKLKELFSKEISLLFESALNKENGTHSFIFIGALERVSFKNGITTYYDKNNKKNIVKEDPLTFLQKYYKKIDKTIYKRYSKELNLGFIDGFIGYSSFDLIKTYEPSLKKHMDKLIDKANIPELDLIRPMLTVAFSHKTNILTLLTPLKSISIKLKKIEECLKAPYSYKSIKKAFIEEDGSFEFTKDEFCSIVEKLKENIKDGDIYQIQIANMFTQKIDIDTLSFYRLLRSKNPSPYMFLFELEDISIVGNSPEVMVKIVDNNILLKPIAGTRKRGKSVEEDKKIEKEFINNEKERSEHIMLVDLGRNDVGRVAKPKSVCTSSFMHIEKYSHVMHIVSNVEAILDNKYDMFDLFRATFPAGTVTGAPKIKAMELIARFEKTKRNIYSGAVAYFDFSGNMDSAIAIRTSFKSKNKLFLQAAAGIVHDSKPEHEYYEIKNKLAALMSSLNEIKK